MNDTPANRKLARIWAQALGQLKAGLHCLWLCAIDLYYYLRLLYDQKRYQHSPNRLNRRKLLELIHKIR